MDQFTETILARARERKRMLEGQDTTSASTPDLRAGPAANKKSLGEDHPSGSGSTPTIPSQAMHKTSSCEGNLSSKSQHKNSITKVCSEISSSPSRSSQSSLGSLASSSSNKHSLNFKNDNINMEIKVTSTDNVRVEVQIEEQSSPESGGDSQSGGEGDTTDDVRQQESTAAAAGGLREDVKNRLNRLGKLYAGGDDANISSPIHKTESKFAAEDMSEETAASNAKNDNSKGRVGSKLANLAKNINQWEDDMTHIQTNKSGGLKNNSQVISKSSPPRSTKKSKAPSPPTPVSSSTGVHKEEQKIAPKKLHWDKKVLDTLESQGFTRTTSSSRLVFNYNLQQEQKTIIKEDATPGSVANKTYKNTLPSVAEKENLTKTATSEDEKSSAVAKLQENKASSPLVKIKGSIADKAAMFEAKSPQKNSATPGGAKEKDPALLSVSERKALFEKNKGTALIPKAPFAMATPVNAGPKPSRKKSPAPKPPATKKFAEKSAEKPEISKAKPSIFKDQLKSVEQQPVEAKVLLNKKPVDTEAAKVKKSLKNQPANDIENDNSSVPKVIQSLGIAQTVASLLEGKSTISQEQIENSVKKQRQQEMEMLLNRFKRSNKEDERKDDDEKEKAEDDDSDQEEEDDDDDDLDDVTEKTAMLSQKQTKIVPPSLPPAVVIQPQSTTSNDRKRNSSNNKYGKADSPKVAAILSDVKRIKVSPNKKAGRLYPSLTDIESQTETENDRSPTPPEDSDENNDTRSSFDDSYAESDDVNTSFGRDILQTVCKNQTPLKRPIAEDVNTSSEMSDLLDGSDDYIKEALAYDENIKNGPTPPKQGRQSPVMAQPSHSFNYKNFTDFKSPAKTTIKPRISDDFPTYVVDGDSVLPLKHSVSVYRKQQNQSSQGGTTPGTTPVRQIVRHTSTINEEEGEQSDGCSKNNTKNNEKEQVQAKIKELQNEVNKQTMVISQTSQALNLCNSTPEFVGSTEQVEAERLLLVSTHRRQAALHELQRLEVEQCLRPQGAHSKNIPLEKGTLTISNIVLPLKQKYVKALTVAGGKGHHVVCLIKCGEQVVPTQLASTVIDNPKNPDTDLKIPGVYKLSNIYSDFTITFEVYCLQAQEEVLPHDVKYHINKKGSKSTPKKSKNDSRLARPVKESPGGPQAVRSPTFAMMGYMVFSVRAINKKHWTLNNTPSMSPLEGTVDMRITCELAVSVEHRGFLTMFEDVSGFGAWHRRWCLLKGDTLSYWKYPDDERKVPPIDSISLKNSITKEVGPVSREICARMHTFLLERERTAHPHDKDTLVMVRKGDKTVIRHLFSADSKEERIEWCNKMNAALTAQHMWGNK